MPDVSERLVVEGIFDPTGLTKGLDIGAASLLDFERMVKQVSKALPGIGNDAAYKIAAQGAKQAAAATKEFSAAVKATTATTNIETAAFTSSTRATNMMRGGLASLAAQSLHTSSAIGQLAQSALFLAGGSTAVIAVAATVLAGSKAWEHYTEDQRQAAKAAKDLTERLKQLREEQKGPVVRAKEDFAAQLSVVEKLERALRDVAAQRELAGKALVARPDADLAEHFNRLLREQTAATKELADARLNLGTAQVAVEATGRAAGHGPGDSLHQ